MFTMYQIFCPLVKKMYQFFEFHLKLIFFSPAIPLFPNFGGPLPLGGLGNGLIGRAGPVLDLPLWVNQGSRSKSPSLLRTNHHNMN